MTTDSNNDAPAGTRVFTPAELARYDGTDESLPVYLAVKGVVFDVTAAKSMYVPGGGYHCFAGKDASRALGKSSLEPSECVPDYSGLDSEEMETLNKWEAHYRKKYPVVGTVA
ncbi:cytochrome b5-like heme/steroid binding domain-containing protein [Cladochytrium replicatum]|nr:cytochrome b5-like heme/steroid binding domain-containing protein [Cladochytrium replicatum]